MKICPTGGYALLAVLWILTGASALALSASLAAREYVATARNRMDLTHAEWTNEACLASVRSALRASAPPAGERAGEALRSAAAIARARGCTADIVPLGRTIDANTADEEVLSGVLTASGVPAGRADSMTAALADWRDTDGVTRPAGAERDWYAARGRPAPRNGPLSDPRELHRIRGFDRPGQVIGAIGVDGARISLNDAPAAVLLALPGAGHELVTLFLSARSRGRRLSAWHEVESRLSPEARERLHARFRELSSATVFEPEAWVLTLRSARGNPPLTAVLEARLERVGEHLEVIGRRTWID